MKRLFFWGIIAPSLLRRLLPAALLESPFLLAARHPWATLLLAAATIAIGGLAVAASGVIPLHASAGHWAITERFLQFSKTRSIATHSLGTEVPPLGDDALVLRGAGHYDLGCSPCHGSVGSLMPPRIARAMLPAPPDLSRRVLERRPEELFFVVKHGLKFTGMPAWPAQTRDDEVWAMVAFLQRLPGLGRAEYERLARGAASELWHLPGSAPDLESGPEAVAEICSRCHGFDGRGRGTGGFPVLAGQRAEYMAGSLRAYAEGRRHSGVMGPIAASLSDEARDAAVRYYASLPPIAAAEVANRRPSPAGEALARAGTGSIPACVECHGPPAAAKEAAYPILDGQYPAYLGLQLRLLQQRRRGGTEYVHLMHSFVDRLTPEQIADVAAYFGSLGAGAPAAP